MFYHAQLRTNKHDYFTFILVTITHKNCSLKILHANKNFLLANPFTSTKKTQENELYYFVVLINMH